MKVRWKDKKSENRVMSIGWEVEWVSVSYKGRMKRLKWVSVCDEGNHLSTSPKGGWAAGWPVCWVPGPGSNPDPLIYSLAPGHDEDGMKQK